MKMRAAPLLLVAAIVGPASLSGCMECVSAFGGGGGCVWYHGVEAKSMANGTWNNTLVTEAFHDLGLEVRGEVWKGSAHGYDERRDVDFIPSSYDNGTFTGEFHVEFFDGDGTNMPPAEAESRAHARWEAVQGAHAVMVARLAQAGIVVDEPYEVAWAGGVY